MDLTLCAWAVLMQTCWLCIPVCIGGYPYSHACECVCLPVCVPPSVHLFACSCLSGTVCLLIHFTPIISGLLGSSLTVCSNQRQFHPNRCCIKIYHHTLQVSKIVTTQLQLSFPLLDPSYFNFLSLFSFDLLYILFQSCTQSWARGVSRLCIWFVPSIGLHLSLRKTCSLMHYLYKCKIFTNI